jgi:hypothetical protein
MFWGWYSFGNGPRSSGCFFLPFLLVCGAPFLFSGFNSRFLLPLLLIAVLGLVIPAILNQSAQRRAYDGGWNGEPFDGDKPKNDFDDKPKRTDDYLYRDDGEVLEVVDAPQEPVYRDDYTYRDDREVLEDVNLPQEPVLRDDPYPVDDEVLEDVDLPQEPVLRDDSYRVDDEVLEDIDPPQEAIQHHGDDNFEPIDTPQEPIQYESDLEDVDPPQEPVRRDDDDIL